MEVSRASPKSCRSIVISTPVSLQSESQQPDQGFDMMDEDDVEMEESGDKDLGTAAAMPMDAVVQEYSEGDTTDTHMSEVDQSNVGHPASITSTN